MSITRSKYFLGKCMAKKLSSKILARWVQSLIILLKNYINLLSIIPLHISIMKPLQYPNIHQRFFPFWVFHWALSGVGMTKDCLLSYSECTQVINRANGLSLSRGSSRPYFLVKRMFAFEGYWHSHGGILYKTSLLNAVICWPLFWFQSEDRL